LHIHGSQLVILHEILYCIIIPPLFCIFCVSPVCSNEASNYKIWVFFASNFQVGLIYFHFCALFWLTAHVLGNFPNICKMIKNVKIYFFLNFRLLLWSKTEGPIATNKLELHHSTAAIICQKFVFQILPQTPKFFAFSQFWYRGRNLRQNWGGKSKILPFLASF